MCDRMAVMYLGTIIEQGETSEIISDPKHPYTEALFDAVPKVEKYDETQRANVSGEVPSPRNPPSGCRFHPRCPEIIPPDDWSGSQDAFRRLASFKHKVKHRTIGPDDVDADGTDPTDQGVEELLDVALSLDIPEEFQMQRSGGRSIDVTRLDVPGHTEQSLRSAARAVLQEDYESGLEILDDYPTICERESPEPRTVDGRSVACHLHGSEATADRTFHSQD
jgi:peptide/nickel transport system ATP-binding protein